MKVLFAVKIGNENWQEELITEHEEKISQAKWWAERNGFDRLRIAEIDLTKKPDFTKGINKKA